MNTGYKNNLTLFVPPPHSAYVRLGIINFATAGFNFDMIKRTKLTCLSGYTKDMLLLILKSFHLD